MESKVNEEILFEQASGQNEVSFSNPNNGHATKNTKVDEQEIEEEKAKFDKIAPERKKAIVSVGIMEIISRPCNSESQLRERLENFKKNLNIQTAKRDGEFASMGPQLDFIDKVWGELIANREIYLQIQNKDIRRAAVDEKLMEMGLIKSDEKMQPSVDEIIAEFKESEKKEDSVKKAIEGRVSQSVLSQENNAEKAENLLYMPGVIRTDKETGKKDMHYGRYSEGRTEPIEYWHNGERFEFKKVGLMTYCNIFGVEDNMYEYLITTPDGKAEVFLYNMSFDKVDDDPQYRKAFFEQLLSPENFQSMNYSGYIGEIVVDNTPEKYNVEYSPERYTAVTELKTRLKEIEQQKGTKKGKKMEEDFDK